MKTYSLSRLSEIRAFLDTEVLAVIIWNNGEREEKRFAQAEEAWMFLAARKKQEANRRNKAERRYPIFAASAGCTLSGQTFSNIEKEIGNTGTAMYDILEGEKKRHAALNLGEMTPMEVEALWMLAKN